jgi:phosphoglycolate phosphatase
LIQPAAIVFDFDLTLADSRAGIAACHAYAMRELALPDADRKVREATAMVGTPLEIVFQSLFPVSDQGEDYLRLYHARADQIMTVSTSLLPGVREAIGALRRANIPLGIVSVKLRSRIEDFLRREGLLSSFNVIVGPEDTTSPKPDPTGLLIALEHLKASAADALYVGDTVIDAETGRRAGVPFVAVLSGFVQEEAFEGYEPLAFLKSAADLPALLFD